MGEVESDSEGYVELENEKLVDYCKWENLIDPLNNKKYNSIEDLDSYWSEKYNCTLKQFFIDRSPSKGKNFYEWCALVNYIRSLKSTKSFSDLSEKINQESFFWTDETYFLPKLEDDALILLFSDNESLSSA